MTSKREKRNTTLDELRKVYRLGLRGPDWMKQADQCETRLRREDKHAEAEEAAKLAANFVGLKYLSTSPPHARRRRRRSPAQA